MATIFGGQASKYWCAKCCVVILTFDIVIPEADSIMLRTGFYYKNNLQPCSWGMNNSFEANNIVTLFLRGIGPVTVDLQGKFRSAWKQRFLLLLALTFDIPWLTTALLFADWHHGPQFFHRLKKNHKKNIQWVNAWVTRFKPGHHGECNPEYSHRGQKKIGLCTHFTSQKRKDENWDFGLWIVCCVKSSLHMDFCKKAHV